MVFFESLSRVLSKIKQLKCDRVLSFAQLKSTVYINWLFCADCDRLENCVQELCCISYKLCVTFFFLPSRNYSQSHQVQELHTLMPQCLLSIVVSAQTFFLKYVSLKCRK